MKSESMKAKTESEWRDSPFAIVIIFLINYRLNSWLTQILLVFWTLLSSRLISSVADYSRQTLLASSSSPACLGESRRSAL